MGEEEEKKKMMVPLSMISPSIHVNRQLSVLTDNFRSWLPQGWTVKLVIRADGTRVDKYYHEPVTNQMFRSRREIERYLNGEECTPPLMSPMLGYHPRLTTGSFRKEKMIMPGGRLLSIDGNEFNQKKLGVITPQTSAPTSPFVLPQGWVVEKVPRKEQGWDKRSNVVKIHSCNIKSVYSIHDSFQHVLLYYYEPGTGRKFRSLVEVERHLQEEKRGNAPLSHVFEMSNWGKKRRRIGTSSASKVIEPPDKIKWILIDSGGLAWDPLMGKTFVPHPVKNQWAFRFMQLMSNKDGVVPDFKRWKSLNRW